MKKIFSKLMIFILLFSMLFVASGLKIKAYYDIDYIHYYEVKVDPREDGTLDMRYKLTWEVLDSFMDGPLTWIKIGIPNCYVDEIKGISSNIDDIFYYSDAGSYMRIDLDRAYHAGEILEIEFSFHQNKIYFFNESQVYYDFNPGWFDEIKVNEAVVLWNNTNVKNHNAEFILDNYLKWSSKLSYGETIKVKVVYDKNDFINISEKNKYSSSYLTKSDKIAIFTVIAVVLLIMIIVAIVNECKKDPYMRERGFYGRGYYHWYRPRRYRRNRYNSRGAKIVNPTPPIHTSGGSSGGFSCACACACAGGGRAGCSRKDFYGNKELKPFVKELNK